MSIRIEVHQTRTVHEPEVYRVNTDVTYAHDIDDSIFVHAVETNEFSHVAYPYDMRTYPKTEVEAVNQGLGYYRKSTSQKDFDDVETAIEGAAYILGRVNLLARTMELAYADFEGETDYIATGSTGE